MSGCMPSPTPPRILVTVAHTQHHGRAADLVAVAYTRRGYPITTTCDAWLTSRSGHTPHVEVGVITNTMDTRHCNRYAASRTRGRPRCRSVHKAWIPNHDNVRCAVDLEEWVAHRTLRWVSSSPTPWILAIVTDTLHYGRAADLVTVAYTRRGYPITTTCDARLTSRSGSHTAR
jgi:hypothetical protein